MPCYELLAVTECADYLGEASRALISTRNLPAATSVQNGRGEHRISVVRTPTSYLAFRFSIRPLFDGIQEWYPQDLDLYDSSGTVISGVVVLDHLAGGSHMEKHVDGGYYSFWQWFKCSCS